MFTILVWGKQRQEDPKAYQPASPNSWALG